MKELLQKLSAMEDALGPNVHFEGDFIGIRIEADGKSASILVRSTDNAMARLWSSEGNPRLYEVAQKEGVELAVAVESVPIAFSAPAGSGGYGAGLSGYGTLGWFFYLDGVLVALSNHHVLCAAGDETKVGTSVFLKADRSRVGKLHSFDPLRTANPRLFDFALAAIDDASLISPSFAACADGIAHPYPRRLAHASDITANANFFTVGAREPTCSDGRFLGVQSSYVSYSDYSKYFFTQQLVFSPMSLPGDSGSIVVEKQSNRVVGLVFAGEPNVRTLANPIYRKGWKFQGTRMTGDLELPSFVTEEDDFQENSQTGLLVNTNFDGFPGGTTSSLPPIFSAGKKIESWESIPALRQRLISTGISLIEISVHQPYGDWVHLGVRMNNPRGIAVLRSGLWLHAPSGVVYSDDWAAG